MKKLIFLISLLLPINASANNPFDESGVAGIILHDHGSILVALKDGVVTNENCSNKDYMILHPSNKHYKEMYSALLAAYHSGSKVAGWVNTCDAAFNFPILTRLDLIEK